MKKVFKYIFLGFIAIILASCTDEFNDIDNKPIVSGNQISFSTKQDNEFDTKGTELLNADLTNFNIFAYASTSTISPTTTMISPSFINNLQIIGTTTDPNSWNYSGAYYWPTQDTLIHFYGVSTNEINTITGFQKGITTWNHPTLGYPSFIYSTDTNVGSQKDLVVGQSYNKENSIPSTRVYLEFTHVLTEINFTCKKDGNAGAPIIVNKIEILNTKTIGTYTFGSESESWGSWTNLTNNSTIIYWQGLSESLANDSDRLILNENMMIIPQGDLTVRVYYGRNINSLSTKEFTISPTVKGGKIRYTVNLPRV